MNLRPELLLHPTIPAPLHGIAPRVVLGQTWWDEQRKIAYALNDDCCHACGTHKSKTLYRKYLEAHEAYNIDYDNHIVTLKEVVALCHCCHNYIHVGRLITQYTNGVVSATYVTSVLDWGMQVVTKAGLKPQATQAIHWLMFKRNFSVQQALQYVHDKGLSTEKFDTDTWDLWKLVVDGQEYNGVTYEEWEQYYG